MQGRVLEDVARNVDAETIRQPVGVCAAIVPFNFPAMVLFWFLPFAIGCGNTFVLKPSEQVPMQQIAFEVLDSLEPAAGRREPGQRRARDRRGDPRPPGHRRGVVRRLGAGRADRLRARGRRPARAGARRGQEPHGRDARRRDRQDRRRHHRSAFGAAGQRCMAGSVVVTVGEAHDKLLGLLREATEQLRVGDGLEDGVDVGPVVSESARDRIRAAIEQAGPTARDRRRRARRRGRGLLRRPTILDGVTPVRRRREEIFGPVLSIIRSARSTRRSSRGQLSRFGNGTSIFTESGASVRRSATRSRRA